MNVLLTTEGTYPFSGGGVSTWCDTLIRNTPEVRYTLLPLMMNPHVELKYAPPANVRRVLEVPMWGIEEPAEFLTDIPFASLYERKQRTPAAAIENEFLPAFRAFIDAVLDGDGLSALGSRLSGGTWLIRFVTSSFGRKRWRSRQTFTGRRRTSRPRRSMA
jgi:hypothetical protein